VAGAAGAGPGRSPRGGGSMTTPIINVADAPVFQGKSGEHFE
jgi:hypothetical protein